MKTRDCAEVIVFNSKRDPENYIQSPLHKENAKKFVETLETLRDSYDVNTLILSDKFIKRYHEMAKTVPVPENYKPAVSEENIAKSFREAYLDLRKIACDEIGTQMNL